jgi:hypothetical protein
MTGWKALNITEIIDFVRKQEESDVAALGLKKPPDPAWPWPLVLRQIKARQKAKIKMPSWLGRNEVIFPAPDLIEQASSETTARYKASLASGNILTDLTAGTGADFLALLENFQKGIAVEQDTETSEILNHNLKILTKKSFEIQNAKAEDAVKNLPFSDLVYLDPQRRTDRRKGLFRLSDCSPDILSLLPALREKAGIIMLKASPVLDIDQAMRDLGLVSDVHVIEWRGECREVIYILNPKIQNTAPLITVIVLDDDGTTKTKLSFTRRQESETEIIVGLPEKYLFEPSPAFLKGGCFKFLAHYYNVKKIHPSTHLYTADAPCPDFPGRMFEIVGLYPADGKGLPVTKANLTIRNFPAETDALRKKLKLKDGGDDYLFACTLMNDRKALIHTRKSA